MTSEFKEIDTFKVLREKWTHEDHVVNHRLSWLLISQAMLMAAYGWSISAPSVKTAKLLFIIPAFGIAFTLAIGGSVIASIVAQTKLSNFPGSASWPQPFQVDTHTPINWFGRLAAICLPFLLFIVWLVVLVA